MGGGLAPPPPMGAVGGSGMVRARVAALEAATGEVGGAATGPVASRTLLARTTTVEVGTQTVGTQNDTWDPDDTLELPFEFPGGGWTLSEVEQLLNKVFPHSGFFFWFEIKKIEKETGVLSILLLLLYMYIYIIRVRNGGFLSPLRTPVI